MKYKIIYHIGDEINIKTKAESGVLSLQSQSVHISGTSPIEIPYSSLVSVELFRLHGLGRMIKVICTNRTIFLTVVRLNIAGYFIIINFFKAGELYKNMKAHITE